DPLNGGHRRDSLLECARCCAAFDSPWLRGFELIADVQPASQYSAGVVESRETGVFERSAVGEMATPISKRRSSARTPRRFPRSCVPRPRDHLAWPELVLRGSAWNRNGGAPVMSLLVKEGHQYFSTCSMTRSVPAK